MFRTYSGQKILQKYKSSRYTGLCRQMTQTSVRRKILLQSTTQLEVTSDKFFWNFGNNLIHSFIPPSALRHVHSLFQSEFSTECDLVLPLSVPSIPSFPSGRPVVAYFFFLIFPSLLPCPVPFLQYRVLERRSYARWDQSSYPSLSLLYVGNSM